METYIMKSIYCGPYVGEFGWELCWWNPLARYYAEQYDRVIVAAPSGSQYLYEFADTFIPLQAIGVTYWEGQLEGDPPVIPADFYLDPRTEFARYAGEPDKISTKKMWKSLAPDNAVHVADILCAFRPQKKIGDKLIAGKEYPIDKCQQIVDMLRSQGLSVACFGGLDNHCPSGTIDLRGRVLEEQCSALAAAKCVVGPSSGPIHLASLCGCPHVTWIASIHHTLEQRYTKLWNPFNTPAKFICHNRLPSPREIVGHVEIMLKKGIQNG